LLALQKFHGKDAGKAFEGAHHSAAAYDMLKNFLIDADDAPALPVAATEKASSLRKTPRWRVKLFTKEDPIGVHKYLGVFCLLHFAFRFIQMYFTGKKLGDGGSVSPSLVPDNGTHSI
jgi:hypothetical protein